MKLCTALMALLLLPGSSSAQPCVDACQEARCYADDACQTKYNICFANAAGDPDAEAACLQQRETCEATADATFYSCVVSSSVSPDLELCLDARQVTLQRSKQLTVAACARPAMRATRVPTTVALAHEYARRSSSIW